MKVLVFVQLVMASILLWSCFCRLTKTDRATHREVRWSIMLMLVTSGMLLGAPFLPELMPAEAHWKPGHTPTWIWLVFAGSVAIQQLVTMKYWRSTCPPDFQKDSAFSGVAAALALGIASIASFPHAALAADAAPGWEPIEDIAYLKPGEQLLCRTGCVVFTPEALKATLAAAGGTCGRIPRVASPAPRT